MTPQYVFIAPNPLAYVPISLDSSNQGIESPVSSFEENRLPTLSMASPQSFINGSSSYVPKQTITSNLDTVDVMFTPYMDQRLLMSYIGFSRYTLSCILLCFI